MLGLDLPRVALCWPVRRWPVRCWIALCWSARCWLMRRRVVAGLAIAFSLSAPACDREAERMPEVVVEEFVHHMLNYRAGVESPEAAYDLLDSDSRHNLLERAKRASAATGRKVEPHEVLVPTFGLRFLPEHYASRIQGGWAIVEVVGSSPEERSEVRCVLEQGKWRIVFDMPPLKEIEKRQHSD